MSSNTAEMQIRTKRHWLIFAPTIFLSASLLFFVQPLFAKMVLPILGGAPAVWTTAMLFFQTALIVGYGYAHLLSRHVNIVGQIVIHGCLWLTALISLPLAVESGWRFDPNEPVALQTLLVFAAGVGLPFVALSANAPLIQHWYASLKTPDAENPYVLYGASNLGSLLSLLAFPLVAEPLFGARTISLAWSVLFVVLGFALVLTAARAIPQDGWKPKLGTYQSAEVSASPSFGQIGRWLFLAFLPSSLMLAITAKISADLGALPLVWVVPLALYLLTFVIVFTRRPIIGQAVLRVFALAAIAFQLAVFGVGFQLTLTLGIGLVTAFFALALFAHDRLYQARPAPSHLTLFYLIMSIGGALGGLFNSIIAPALFSELTEAPVTLVLFAIAVGWGRMSPKALAFGIIAAAIFFVVSNQLRLMDLSDAVLTVSVLVLSGVLILAFARAGVALPLFVGLAIIIVNMTGDTDLRFADRSFFGTHRIVDRDGIRLYANGTTLHGSQRQSDIGAERPEPLTYYHALAPMGQIMAGPRGIGAGRIGIVGLGVGALACHAKPGQDWHFYEIDPLVDDIARDSEQFTYLTACTPDAPTHLGDARVVLESQPGLSFDILVIDAYSSDAVPVHLTTVEAMQLYLDRLTTNGLLVMHISNRYFSLEQPIARLAEELGLSMRIQYYGGSGDPQVGDRASIVAILGRGEAAFGSLADDPRWEPATANGFPLWSDDYANPLSALKAFR